MEPAVQRRSAWGAAACLVVLALAGCTLSPQSVRSPGPFGDPLPASMTCAPPEPEMVWFGARTLTNSGSEPVRIDQVRLTEATGIKVIESVLVPDVEPPGQLGVTADPGRSTATAWHERIPAAGAVVEPGQTYELVLRLQRTERIGAFGGVRVEYSDDANTYARTEDRAGLFGITRKQDCRR